MHPRSLLFRREPVWRTASSLFAPVAFRSWLEEPASLTARLRRSVGAGFAVQLLGQGDARAFASESAGLGLVNHRLALVREVSLSNGTVPLVLARTIMPPEARRGKHSVLAKLGNRPLGEFLFTQRTLRRPRLEFARVPPEDWLPSIAQDYGLNKTIWGRRSLYEIDTVSLLVCEFFLPAVLNL